MPNIIDTWTINYRPEGGGRIAGCLTVTDVDVQFSSADLEEDIVLPRPDIADVQAARRRLMKQAVVTMKDGQRHVFEYGLLSVGPIIDAISSV
ncbi:MAG: hypothetical protein ACTSUD_01860 [Alphaproteobacteria bacterium]